ncbi:SusD/RagB family nutrient-binding outer membrane lipoprotein, partial [Rhodobacteraceae bacterium 4F10]
MISCVDEDLNIDKKNPSQVSGATLFANGTRNMFDLMNSCSVNDNVFRLYAQYWAQTTYPDESQFNQTGRNIGGSIWNTLYRDVLKDLDGAKTSVKNSVDNPNKENQLAIIEFTTVYAYSILVDTFGDVPYTEALDPDNPTPKYDDAETIYLDLLDRLSKAIQTIDTNGNFGFDDFIYNGDISKWKKAANSLMLRM